MFVSRSHSPRTHPVGGGVGTNLDTIVSLYAEQRYDTTGTTTYWVFLNNLGVVKLHQWRQVSQPLDRGLVPSHGSYVTRSHRNLFFFFFMTCAWHLILKNHWFPLFNLTCLKFFFYAPLDPGTKLWSRLSSFTHRWRSPPPLPHLRCGELFYILYITT